MKHFYRIILLWTLFLTGAYGQHTVSSLPGNTPRFEIASRKAVLRSDTLHLSYDLVMSGRVISPREVLYVYPVYRLPGGGEQRFLPLIVCGSDRMPYYKRRAALQSRGRFWEERNPEPHLYGGRRSQEFHYASSQRVSGFGTLHLELYVEDCCDRVPVSTEEITVTRYQSPSRPRRAEESQVSFLRPRREELKQRSEHLTVRMDYPVNQYRVLSDFGDNGIELERVHKSLGPLLSRPDTYRIGSAVLRGYASPEGSFDSNMELSLRRASEFRAYLLTRYPRLPRRSFSATGMGEDWDGLRALIEEEVDMPQYDRVLSIMDRVGIHSGREKQLMELGGGEPYR